MSQPDLNDIAAFLAVARERSFTRAAAQLGVSQSALSQTVRHLESRMGLRLLTRTTRSVVPTEAGEHLIDRVGRRMEEIDEELAALGGLREKPSGTIRISATENAASSIVLPALQRLLPDYPDIRVEIVIDYGLTDIVARKLDAGIRPGETVAQGMASVPIAPPMRMAVVGSPAYFVGRERPRKPQDLTSHRCINLRLPTHDGLYAWEFGKAKRAMRVRVEGQLVVNTASLMLNAALADLGLAYLAEQQVQPCLDDGRLIRVLADWCEPFPGYHLYFPSRRQQTPAFALFVEALRYKG